MIFKKVFFLLELICKKAQFFYFCFFLLFYKTCNCAALLFPGILLFFVHFVAVTVFYGGLHKKQLSLSRADKRMESQEGPRDTIISIFIPRFLFWNSEAILESSKCFLFCQAFFWGFFINDRRTLAQNYMLE